jgi:hypothetical protein
VGQVSNRSVEDKEKNKDYDYVVRIVQYLDNKHGISFFITPKDFDTLYRWWEKRIPIRIVKDSITAVVERWQDKNRTISRFSSFKYEVRKNFEAFLQLSVGGETDGNKETSVEPETPLTEMETFLENFPEPLNELKGEFEALHTCMKNNEPVEPTVLYEKLTVMFTDDGELNLKTELFIKNLAPELRKPEIEQRYRLNYLINKFRIPDFE